MLGNEDLIVKLRRKHRPRVEPHADRGAMRIGLPRGGLEFTARVFAAKLWIGDLSRVTVRKSERKTFLRCVIQLVGRNVVAEQIAAVVGKPQLARCRMPVESNAVAHAAGEDLGGRAIRLHAKNRRKPRILRPLADVERATNGNQKQPVGSASEDLPSVMALGGQIALYNNRRGWLFECGLDVVVPGYAADLADIQRAISKCDAARIVQALRDRVDLVGLVILVA